MNSLFRIYKQSPRLTSVKQDFLLFRLHTPSSCATSRSQRWLAGSSVVDLKEISVCLQLKFAVHFHEKLLIPTNITRSVFFHTKKSKRYKFNCCQYAHSFAFWSMSLKTVHRLFLLKMFIDTECSLIVLCFRLNMYT